ncbi:MAG: hypothetical protein A3B74_03055 [Candidatus Kerfeldbacteria bacterium RIFCSPHIGHO2_02_FULL_42_14]|uniref:Methyltransferase domain-containing protein n=1 Tax=Candidatus Kerfeldbacteria bacterium RIFCSPHIGHO2_02_FULL_42_14 TaxID=1798540 RepID=A0A1G2AQ32_9BACT|nr:MAG: hypothetical protein A3B74_03055 [Candidatus Kerfeldbacteria bacterium RIFCSPHIGHO2_02_FULL_42_14]OGY82271.1 MAG: hypothetical protein A3E60_00345 [Candidatus Kerfeldbacteria bacterium RIFCSPHIGHO2_12_FULL_42_13]OGY84122.1 MAG: hypothetical protein A3I91_01365 [Candidatus Kerfeldbacteria bacterium RIFCSPLOWO2_02_FULL_42_19]OGY87252.1 MAG: hypothetical protein A3G01_02835 [Candidatus Kerfeldbacteria bacterium RIFCSPLOWO2_12_FULL_43_9]
MEQFNIPEHYDVMADLDRDVHDDIELSRSEAALAVSLIQESTGSIPRSVFLPCFGTGRHIVPLFKLGVKKITGVDLSATCIKKALTHLTRLNGGNIVQLTLADLRSWYTNEEFDAVLLLGNSFADIIDPSQLTLFTAGMLRSLKSGGVFVMDYIGERYLERCRTARQSTWHAVLNGVPVLDCRVPKYDSEHRVLQIDVRVEALETHELVWTGFYQKLILTPTELIQRFGARSVELQHIGLADELNPYYSAVDSKHPLHAIHGGDLGMLQESDWWVGRKMK